MTDLEERTRPSTALSTLSGVDTLARLLVLRHQLDVRDGLDTATMVSGYPGSPLGTFDLAVERLHDLLAAHRVLHRPGLNEELAAATVWGSQMGASVPYAGVDGVAGVWYGKTPGLDRSGDALKHGNAMGAGPNGGVVLFCGDDPTAKSSTLPCDSQYTFEDACIPVLYPGNQQDVIDLGVHAFWLSRHSGAWVGLKVVTSVADGLGTVDLDPERHAPPQLVAPVVDGEPWRHRPLATIGPHQVPDQELLVVHHRLAAARSYARNNGLDQAMGPPGARLGVVCAGTTYFDLLQAFADLGVGPDELASVGVRVLKLAMTYPLVPETVLEFAASVDEVLVVEEKRPFVETQLRSILHEAGSRVPVRGKRDRAGRPLISPVGDLDAAAVGSALIRVLPDLATRRRETVGKTGLPLLALPARAPSFCSGCPHNRSTIFPDDALVGGGVGCHGIMYFEARHQGMKSLAPTPMGAEGVPWIGLAPFVDEPHLIQNLGDGTLSHSGTLAIRACVAAGVDVTFKILYNSAVAMTGGQDVTGVMDVPALTRALEAEGVRRVVVCAEDPHRYPKRARWAPDVRVYGRDRLPQVQEELRQVAGVTAIIYDQRCAAEARRLRKRGLLAEPPQRVFINEAVCEGCGDCSTKSNCISVLPHETEFGEKRQIHDPSCNRDYTCLEGDCPSFVTITPKRRARRRRLRRRSASRAGGPTRPSLPSGSLPVPPVAPVDGRCSIYFTGIGGTGVVTANRILAAAAESAGLVVGGMDQTGLSQKAGAVVSHLHLARHPSALTAAAVAAGGADLYLSGDILQAASPAHLEKVRPGRTTAVVDCAFTPTSAMLQRDLAPPDGARLEAAIAERVGADRSVFLDSSRIAETVFDNHLLANIVLLGAAFQVGALPLSLDDVERAMQQQGRAAADNREAFAWGRWAVQDPAAVEARLAAGGEQGGGIFDPSPEAAEEGRRVVAGRRVPAELRELVCRRVAQVIDYQDARRAARFVDLVERAAAADEPGRGWALTRAVAESWFKLLTYKDEYEVARLHLKADHDRVAGHLGIEGPFSVTYHLHPPVLRRLGLSHKLPMGKPYEVAFHALRRMKRLRGTPLDPFGWDPDRRTERALIDEYERLIGDRLDRRPALPYDTLVELAASAQSIKGYGPIKEAAVGRWRQQVAQLSGAEAATG